MCKMIVVVLLSLLFGFSNVAIAETLPVSTNECIVTHVVKKGETLTKIAKNFGVSIDSILSPRINAALVERNNPDLIFVNERIQVALPAVAVKSVPVVPEVTTGTTAEAGLDVVENEGMQYVKIAFFLAVFTAVELFLLGVYLLARDWRSRTTSEGTVDHEADDAKKEGMTSADGIIEALGEARVEDLVLAMHMPIAIDEKGNQVLLCNIERFMQNEARKLRLQGGLVKDLSRNIKTLGEV
ncbi:MAG: LysM domain-containing protein [Minisyncoccia bacterium]